MYVCNQRTIRLLSVLQSTRGEVYSHHRHSICSTLKSECINCCWLAYLNVESEPAWFCSPAFYYRRPVFIIFFRISGQTTANIVLCSIVQHAYPDNRSPLLKNF